MASHVDFPEFKELNLRLREVSMGGGGCVCGRGGRAAGRGGRGDGRRGGRGGGGGSGGDGEDYLPWWWFDDDDCDGGDGEDGGDMPFAGMSNPIHTSGEVRAAMRKGEEEKGNYGDNKRVSNRVANPLYGRLTSSSFNGGPRESHDSLESLDSLGSLDSPNTPFTHANAVSGGKDIVDTPAVAASSRLGFYKSSAGVNITGGRRTTASVQQQPRAMGSEAVNGSTSSTPVVTLEVSDGADVKDTEEGNPRRGTWMAQTSNRDASIEIDDVDTVEESGDDGVGGGGDHGRGGGYGGDCCEGVVSFDGNSGEDDDGHKGNSEDGGYDGYEGYGSVTHGESQGEHGHNEHGKHEEEQGWNGEYGEDGENGEDGEDGEHGEHVEHGEYEHGEDEFGDSDGGYNGRDGQAEHDEDGVDVLAVARAQLRKVFGRLGEGGAEWEDGGWGQHQYVAK